MEKSRPSKLEAIIVNHDRGSSVVYHPHEKIASYVLLVAFFALMFLFGIVLFFVSKPAEMTGMVLIDFHTNESIDNGTGIADTISGLSDKLLAEDSRTEFLMILYVCWIFIIGAIQLYRIEKQS